MKTRLRVEVAGLVFALAVMLFVFVRVNSIVMVHPGEIVIDETGHEVGKWERNEIPTEAYLLMVMFALSTTGAMILLVLVAQDSGWSKS